MLQHLPDMIIAVGTLGTASYGLVDVTKAFGGGVSNHGFSRIERMARRLHPDPAGLDMVLQTLRANWLNGVPLAEQIATAQQLIPQSPLLVDGAYQRADQIYRNATKAWSVLVSVILAVLGGFLVLWDQTGAAPSFGDYLASPDLYQALLAGLLATPLAPISKDLASALGAAVKAMQLVRGGRP